jgi:hypothetical protein
VMIKDRWRTMKKLGMNWTGFCFHRITGAWFLTIVPDSLLFPSEAGLEWEFWASSFSVGRFPVHFITVGDHGTKRQSQACPCPWQRWWAHSLYSARMSLVFPFFSGLLKFKSPVICRTFS